MQTYNETDFKYTQPVNNLITITNAATIIAGTMPISRYPQPKTGLAINALICEFSKKHEAANRKVRLSVKKKEAFQSTKLQNDLTASETT